MTRCASVQFVPDPRRVITKPFLPGEEIYPDGSSRLQVVLERVMALSEREVADTFEVPLAYLMDPANHRLGSRQRNGRERHFYEMPYGERYIWGATASMIKNMQLRLFPGQ